MKLRSIMMKALWWPILWHIAVWWCMRQPHRDYECPRCAVEARRSRNVHWPRMAEFPPRMRPKQNCNCGQDPFGNILLHKDSCPLKDWTKRSLMICSKCGLSSTYWKRWPKCSGKPLLRHKVVTAPVIRSFVVWD